MLSIDACVPALSTVVKIPRVSCFPTLTTPIKHVFPRLPYLFSCVYHILSRAYHNAFPRFPHMLSRAYHNAFPRLPQCFPALTIMPSRAYHTCFPALTTMLCRAYHNAFTRLPQCFPALATHAFPRLPYMLSRVYHMLSRAYHNAFPRLPYMLSCAYHTCFPALTTILSRAYHTCFPVLTIHAFPRLRLCGISRASLVATVFPRLPRVTCSPMLFTAFLPRALFVAF